LLENPLVLFRDPVAGIVDSERRRNEVLANTLQHLFRRRIRTEIGGKIADQDEARRVVANIDEASRTERQPERRNG
jgi:hypothetical protein